MINIDATGFNQTGGLGVNGAADRSASINVAENKKSNGTTTQAFAGVVVSGDGVDTKALDQNTYESLMSEADDVKAQIMQSATEAKMNLKNLVNRLNGADAVKINEDGFNLNDLSDEECVDIVDRIKIELAAYNDNYRQYAGDIDVDKIKQVVGSEGFAQQIAGQLGDSGVPATDANLADIVNAVDKLSDITGESVDSLVGWTNAEGGNVSVVNADVTGYTGDSGNSGVNAAGDGGYVGAATGGYQMPMGAKLYMAANGSEATLDNIQVAQASYMTRGGQLSESSWNELKPQVENVIKRAGLDVNDSNLANAKALLDEDMPVTEKNLVAMAALDDIDFSVGNVVAKTITAIAQGRDADKAVLTEGRDMYDDVTQALATLKKLNKSDIAAASGLNNSDIMAAGQSSAAVFGVDGAAVGGLNNSDIMAAQENDASYDYVKTAQLVTYVRIAEGLSDDGIVNLRSLDEAYELYIANPQKYAGVNSGSGEDGSKAFGDGADGGRGTGSYAGGGAGVYVDGGVGSDGTAADDYESGSELAMARQLRQIQILMTAQTGLNLEKNGLSINTVPIATLHENLLALDKEIFMQELGDQLAHDIDADEAYSTVYNTREALYDISNSPIDLVGAIAKELAYTKSASEKVGERQVVSVMSASRIGTSLRSKLNKAGEAYETMGSTVRADLGDSVNRAVEASAGAMLNNMNMEDNSANREAVGILVRNGMDVTEGNVNTIKELKSTLDSLVANMNPETALDMIRNNINPYTSDIREVNEYLKTSNEENGRDLNEKYSTFLYKLDRTDGITSEERKEFIGIYKMMNMFTKDAGKAIGALVAQGADITMENLTKAYNSRRSYNKMDMSVADDSDINVAAYENYYTNMFAATGDKITPNTLKNVEADRPIYERSVENFCDAADEFYDASAEAAYMDEYMELARQIAEVDSSVINELERADEDITLNNIQAMEQLMMSDLFNNAFAIDRDKARDIFDSLDDRDELNRKLQELGSSADEDMANQIESDDNTYETVKRSSISQMAAQMMVRSARREDYTIPYVKEDGIGVMKVSFRTDSEESGKINISFKDESLGDVSVNLSVGEGVSISAVYATNAPIRGTADEQERAAVEAFRTKLGNVGEELREKFGFRNVDVYVNPVRNVSRTIYGGDGSDVSNATLYRVAKTVVEGLV